jgi:hypothetical protein
MANWEISNCCPARGNDKEYKYRESCRDITSIPILYYMLLMLPNHSVHTNLERTIFVTGGHRVEALKGNTAVSRNEKASVLSSPPALCFVRPQHIQNLQQIQLKIRKGTHYLYPQYFQCYRYHFLGKINCLHFFFTFS